MSDDAVLYDVQGHVGIITLNRPEKLNAFSNEMLELWAGLYQHGQPGPGRARGDRDRGGPRLLLRRRRLA